MTGSSCSGNRCEDKRRRCARLDLSNPADYSVAESLAKSSETSFWLRIAIVGLERTGNMVETSHPSSIVHYVNLGSFV